MDAAELAKRIRVHSLKMTSSGGSAHVAPCLSCADILAVLYSGTMRKEPSNPKWPGRDRFIMSKGHAGAALYAALAESGYFPAAKLSTHYQDGSDLCGHVSHKGIPGVEFSSGSLGHGLGIAAGVALSGKLDGEKFRVFALLSDGECDEGSVWEAALFAAHHKLSNLCCIIDYNKIQSLASVAETLALEPFADKWRAFGWEVVEADGHAHAELRAALVAERTEAPRCVIAHTTKGKGVSFMENTVLWHYRTARGDEFDRALSELER